MSAGISAQRKCALTVSRGWKKVKKGTRMLKSPSEKRPDERPSNWPYPGLNAVLTEITDPYEEEGPTMDLEIRTYHGLLEVITFKQRAADDTEVLRRLKDFIVGRNIKSVIINITENTRHD